MFSHSGTEASFAVIISYAPTDKRQIFYFNFSIELIKVLININLY